MKTKLHTLSEKLEHPLLHVLKSIRSDYIQNRFTFIKGNDMKDILRFFGATDNDFLELEYSGNLLGKDPTLPFRESRNGRFSIDFNKNSISRLEFQPFILSKEEEFNRDDSGLFRHFRGIQDNIQNNKAFQGLIRFQACVLEGIDILKRSNLEDDWNIWISTIFQLRTITTSKLIGEPAKEGVHSDGVEHTMTTLLRTKNISKNSAITQIHNQHQKLGINHHETNTEHIVAEFQHKHFLDTILIVDTEYRHSLSPINAMDEETTAIRDMIILFTRRPKASTHITYQNDSLHTHAEIPQDFPIIPI